MKEKVNVTFVKIIADFSIFLEFSNDDVLNEDIAIEMMEQLASRLQSLSEDERSSLTEQFHELSLSYTDNDKADFVRDLPESFGIT